VIINVVPKMGHFDLIGPYFVDHHTAVHVCREAAWGWTTFLLVIQLIPSNYIHSTVNELMTIPQYLLFVHVCKYPNLHTSIIQAIPKTSSIQDN
jgi:hypothetical protein